MSVVNAHASYLTHAFDSPENIIEQAREIIGDRKFDTLVGTGLSGALVVPLLARAFECNWMIVRKEDGTHSAYACEGRLGKRWIFVDDLIDTGGTLKRVREKIKLCAKERDHKTTYAGAYLYDNYCDSPRFKGRS